MKVGGEGVSRGRLRGLARDMGVDVEQQRVGYFRLVPLTGRYAVEGGDEVCLHGYREFIRRCLRRGWWVETALRRYDRRADLDFEDPTEIRAEVEARYGPQSCRCAGPGRG